MSILLDALICMPWELIASQTTSAGRRWASLLAKVSAISASLSLLPTSMHYRPLPATSAVGPLRTRARLLRAALQGGCQLELE